MSDRSAAEALAAAAGRGDVTAVFALCDCLRELCDPRAELLTRRLRLHDSRVQDKVDWERYAHGNLVSRYRSEMAVHRGRVADGERLRREHAARVEAHLRAVAEYAARMETWRAARAAYDAWKADKGWLGRLTDAFWGSADERPPRPGPEPKAPTPPQPPASWLYTYQDTPPAGVQPPPPFDEDRVRRRASEAEAAVLGDYVFRLMRTRPGETAVTKSVRKSAPIVW